MAMGARSARAWNRSCDARRSSATRATSGSGARRTTQRRAPADPARGLTSPRAGGGPDGDADEPEAQARAVAALEADVATQRAASVHEQARVALLVVRSGSE